MDGWVDGTKEGQDERIWVDLDKGGGMWQAGRQAAVVPVVVRSFQRNDIQMFKIVFRICAKCT